MEKTYGIREYFADVETVEGHNGYYFSVTEALTIVILGSFCGLRNCNLIHQWAANAGVAAMLREHFGIEKVPSYYWLLCLLKLIKPESLNRCFMRWTQSFLPDGKKALTISFDGKAIRSTGKMDAYEKPLHIVSAHIAQLGITVGQRTVDEKSNEIPAVRELLALLNVKGCMIVADALHCQKETAIAIVEAEADYLLSVKDNQKNLHNDLMDYVQDDELRKTMVTCTKREKSRDRIEKRTAFVTNDIGWLEDCEDWAGLACIGAINTQFTTKKGTTNEWHYYISSRKLSAKDLLEQARCEWSVETMHWLLDMHFGEDYCRIQDEDVQQSLNIIRKIALNSIKLYKEKSNSKLPLSKIMFASLLDFHNLLDILVYDCLEN